MTYQTTTLLPMYTGYGAQANEFPIVYDSLSRPIICWTETPRGLPFWSADSGVTISGISTNRGREITLDSGRSYYIWARPNFGASAANTSIEVGIYINGTNTLVGTKGRGQTGQSLRLLTEIYGMTASAVILPSDFSGSTLVLQVRFDTLSGTWNQNAQPVNDDTDAQGQGELVIYSTP